MEKATCTLCDKPVLCRSWCAKHYTRWYKYGDPNTVLVDPSRTLEERFWPRVEKTDNCWLWTGGATGEGYGAIKYEGRQEKTHRVSFYLANGYWPTLSVLHRCDTPLCVNPAHLWEGTHADNMKDMASKGRGRGRNSKCL